MENAVHRNERVSTSDPSGTDEAAAATLIDLQSMTECTMRNNAPTTGLPVRGDVDHHSFEPLQMDTNLDHAMSLNANNDIATGNMQSVIQGQSIPQLSQNLSGVDFEFSPPVMGSWGMHEESLGSWQISDDFDLENFNASLFLPNILEQTAWPAPQAIEKLGSPNVSVEDPRSLTASDMEEIQNLWITKTVNNFWKNDGNASYSVGPSRPVTPTIDHPSVTTVDDSYRNALTRRLRTRWKELALPSTEFLVWCYRFCRLSVLTKYTELCPTTLFHEVQPNFSDSS